MAPDSGCRQEITPRSASRTCSLSLTLRKTRLSSACSLGHTSKAANAADRRRAYCIRFGNASDLRARHGQYPGPTPEPRPQQTASHPFEAVQDSPDERGRGTLTGSGLSLSSW